MLGLCISNADEELESVLKFSSIDLPTFGR